MNGKGKVEGRKGKWAGSWAIKRKEEVPGVW